MKVDVRRQGSRQREECDPKQHRDGGGIGGGAAGLRLHHPDHSHKGVLSGG